MNKRWTQVPRFLALLLLVLTLEVVTLRPSEAKSQRDSPPGQTVYVPTVALRAASGATIPFATQNGETIYGVPPRMLDVPHLVLTRNGALSSAEERTLVVEVTGVDVPPTGVIVTLALETQHGDPDSAGDTAQRIPVWRESRWLASSSSLTRTNVTVAFVHEFGETLASGPGAIATPTDYFRYEVTVMDAKDPRTNPRHPEIPPAPLAWPPGQAGARAQAASGRDRLSEDYAFLMESQWIAPLPAVNEASPGAAPDELVVYYCDMFPFQRAPQDPATWLRRGAVPGYVGAELLPQMVEAYRVQSDEWGFPWYDAWTPYRLEDPERLSVALTDGRTWFHGWAPARGHSGLSLQVNGGGHAAYETLTDGLLSVYHHELFHNLQRNIVMGNAGNGPVDGAEDAWQFYSEGTAVLAASVGQPRMQWIQIATTPTYLSYANRFIRWGGGHLPGMNTSYAAMDPYTAVIYWRFLYEQCGGMREGREDPATGMQVIRRALTALYSGEAVDIHTSTDLVGALPKVMDRALAGSSCPFQTYKESLIAFAHALYGLRLDGGKCVEPGVPAGCGFYDPYDQYQEPPVHTIAYAGVEQAYRDGIGSSYGIDLIEVHLDPAAGGQPLALEFHPAPGSAAAFNVEIVLLVDSSESPEPRPVPAEMAATEILAKESSDRHATYIITEIYTGAYNRLGLIITRLDAQEALDPAGAYAIVLRPSAEGAGASSR